MAPMGWNPMADHVMHLLGLAIIVVLIGFVVYSQRRSNTQSLRLLDDKAELDRFRQQVKIEAETLKKSFLLEAQNEALAYRKEIDQENRETRAELQRLEKRLFQKEENLDRKLDQCERRDREAAERQSTLDQAHEDLVRLRDQTRA